MRRGWLVFLLGCGADREAAPAPAVTPRPPSAAAKLAASFSPEVVGAISAVDPTPGDYAMRVDLTYQRFVTTELALSERRTGTWRLALAPDGTVTSCLGVRRILASAGQRRYEKDPAKREHRETGESRLVALGGTWKLEDGIATIAFDRARVGTCDLASAQPHQLALRCVGIAAPPGVTAPRLACESAGDLFDLGMPMTVAARAHPARESPTGPNVIFGAPGLAIEVRQRHPALPSFELAPRSVMLVEAEFSRR